MGRNIELLAYLNFVKHAYIISFLSFNFMQLFVCSNVSSVFMPVRRCYMDVLLSLSVNSMCIGSVESLIGVYL